MMRVDYHPAAEEAEVAQCYGHTMRANRRCRRRVRHQLVPDEHGAEPFIAPFPIYCPWHREQEEGGQ